jgi:hypothetical protein
METVSLERLVAQVDQRATSDDPLDRVDAALVVAGTLAGQADALIDRVVAEARAAGRSWTEIGERLGVSKQAARKRFIAPELKPELTPVLPPEVSLHPRLQACVARAEQLAPAHIGAEHLLAGLLTDGVAATVLDKLGVTADAIAASTTRLFGPAGPATGAAPAWSTDAVCAIEAAAHQAQVRAEDPDHVTVGTEHLLAVLALDYGSRAHRVLVDLGVDIATVKKELACYVEPKSRRLRRRSTRTCSFCGAAESARRPVVHGPGVTICTVCVQRAAQNLPR